MKIPRDLSSESLIKLLNKFNYNVTRQTSSHIRLTAKIKEREHHITIPQQKFLKIGTLNNILNDIAKHLEIDKKELLVKLFG